MNQPAARPDAPLVELSALHLVGVPGVEIDEDTGGRLHSFLLDDGEEAVVIGHEFGGPEACASRLLAVAEALREHAEDIRYRVRQRSAGWT